MLATSQPAEPARRIYAEKERGSDRAREREKVSWEKLSRRERALVEKYDDSVCVWVCESKCGKIDREKKQDQHLCSVIEWIRTI